MTAPTCPSDADLRALLEDALDPTAVSTIEDHVNACPACEKRLGGILPAGAELLQLQAHLDSDGRELSPTLPGYEILGVLGRGGMGVVYKARHIKLDRVVALKMVTESKGRNAVLMARFFAEAQAVASVNHPNVVEVYDFGEADGRAFLAMELLGGGTFAEQLRATPILAPKEAAAKIEQIARGVAAAHDAEIVHRDLKPGNVMFAANGTPKVTDFGLAKRVTSDLTASQAIVGTPHYMAPEQASGKGKFVGPTTDVWALGVMLFECLAGRRPFESSDAMSLLVKIVNEDPPRIRALVKGLPRELDVIVNKCLAKEPGERYGSANELADDLRRYQDGLPILAKPAGTIEKAYKWARRNPGWAAMTTVLMLTMLTGTTVSLFYADQANKNATRAEANATDANNQKTLSLAAAEQEKLAKNREAEQRVRAEGAVRRTEGVLDAMTSTLAENALTSQRELSPEQRQLLTGLLAQYRETLMLDEVYSEDEANWRRYANAGMRVGFIEKSLGNTLASVSAFNAAAAEFAKLVKRFPDSASRIDDERSRAECLISVGYLNDRLGEHDAALVCYREGISALESLSRRYPNRLDLLTSLAGWRLSLGGSLIERRRYQEAKAEGTAAVATLTALLSTDPKKSDYLYRLGLATAFLGEIELLLNKPSEALNLLDRGKAYLADAVTTSPDDHRIRRELARTSLSAAEACEAMKQVLRAFDELESARKLLERLAQQYPQTTDYQRELAVSYSQLAALSRSEKREADAEKYFKESLGIRIRLFERHPEELDFHRDLARTHNNYGNLLADRKKRPEAQRQYEAALDINRLAAAKYPEAFDILARAASNAHNLAELAWEEKDHDAATRFYTEAAEFYERLLKSAPPAAEYLRQAAGTFARRGQFQRSRNELTGCLPSLDRAIDLYTRLRELSPKADDAKSLQRNMHSMRAEAREQLRQYTEAAEDRRQAVILSPLAEQSRFRPKYAMALIRAGKTPEAVAEVAELIQLPNWNAGQWYDFACVFSVASGKIADKKAEYADRAMELLQKAVKAGYKDVAFLKQDKFLDPIRERDDLKKLLAELQKK